MLRDRVSFHLEILLLDNSTEEVSIARNTRHAFNLVGIGIFFALWSKISSWSFCWGNSWTGSSGVADCVEGWSSVYLGLLQEIEDFALVGES